MKNVYSNCFVSRDRVIEERRDFLKIHAKQMLGVMEMEFVASKDLIYQNLTEYLAYWSSLHTLCRTSSLTSKICLESNIVRTSSRIEKQEIFLYQSILVWTRSVSSFIRNMPQSAEWGTLDELNTKHSRLKGSSMTTMIDGFHDSKKLLFILSSFHRAERLLGSSTWVFQGGGCILFSSQSPWLSCGRVMTFVSRKCAVSLTGALRRAKIGFHVSITPHLGSPRSHASQSPEFLIGKVAKSSKSAYWSWRRQFWVK